MARILAIAAFLVALPAWADAPARLHWTAELDGQAIDCATAEAVDLSRPTAAPTTGAPGELELVPGHYSVRVRCAEGDEKLVTVEEITLKSGQISTKKLALKRGRLRGILRRDGNLVPGNVALLAPKAPGDAPVLMRAPASQKFQVIAGTYDVVLEVDPAKYGRPAAVRVPGVVVAPGAVKEVAVELGDGKLEVAAQENGKSAEGAIRVFRPGESTPVGHGPTGNAIALPPGRYLVETVLSGASDYPTHKSEIWVEPNKTAKLSERYDTGRLTVGVFRERQPVEAVVQLSLPGAQDFFNYFSAPGTVSLTPGVYDVNVAVKTDAPIDRLKRPRVTVTKGNDNKIFFDITPAKLSVKVTRAGKNVEDADVKVLFAGGGSEATHAETDGSYRVWPGRYEIVVKLPAGDEARAGPFEVGFGENVNKTIEFSRGMLAVHAMRGKAVAEDAEVFVFKKGAQKPIAQGRAAAMLDLSPGAYDVKIVAGSASIWREDVKIKEAKTTQLEVSFNGAGDGGTLPEGDLAPEKENLPEGE
ncbi:MAG: hypothetical protein U1E65_08190 [Myxococcota bacterium]